jgi:5-aminopentanamidase
MKIAGVQFKPKFGKTENNIKKVLDIIDSVETDVIIFPELCLSGYFFLSRNEVDKISLDFRSDEINELQKKSTSQNKIVIFGFAEKSGDKLFNSSAILFPDKKLSTVYRKIHLFYKERFCFDKGEKPFFVIEDKSKDITIGPMICYDWRFPEASRSLALLGADLIVCPSNLVTAVWHKVMPARAIENKVYFAVINRIGTEKRNNEELFFNGESVIYGYNGEILAKAGVEDEKIIHAEIFPELTRKKSFNEFNDIFSDRRPYMYNL